MQSLLTQVAIACTSCNASAGTTHNCGDPDPCDKAASGTGTRFGKNGIVIGWAIDCANCCGRWPGRGPLPAKTLTTSRQGGVGR